MVKFLGETCIMVMVVEHDCNVTKNIKFIAISRQILEEVFAIPAPMNVMRNMKVVVKSSSRDLA